MAKRTNPYDTLRRQFSDFASKVEFPNTRVMYTLPADKLKSGYRMDDIAERVAAAETLGYDVVLRRADNGDLRILYRQKPPARPWNVP